MKDYPREKLMQHGVHTLTDAELIALFLQTGYKGKTVLELSYDVLNHFGSLRNLLDANLTDLLILRGIGTGKGCLLQAAMELGKRYLRARLSRLDLLTCPEDTRTYLMAELKSYPHEVFGCLFLDIKHRIICFEKLFHGTVDQATIHPREIVKRALTHNAAAIIFAHNHPSGSVDPSTADHELTKQLTQLFSLLQIRVLDHIIIGDGNTFSFVEHGWV